MSKVWKWILGILIALVIVAAVAGVIFMARSHMAFAFAQRGNAPFSQEARPGWNNQNMPYGGYGFRSGPGFGDRGWEHGPMMMHRGFGFGFPFFGGFMLIGGLFKLAIFIGLLYFAYWLGKRNARITLDPKPAPASNEPPAN